MRVARAIARALRRLAKLLVTLFGTSPRQARRLVALASQSCRRGLHHGRTITQKPSGEQSA